MSIDSSSELFPVVQEKNVYPNGGVVAKVEKPFIVDAGGIPANQLIRDVFVGAIPLSDKRNLGNDCVSLVGLPEARLVYGGQDCAGALTFDGGRILAILAAADGCSFGERKNSAEAARIAVRTLLLGGYQISRRPGASRQQVTEILGNFLKVANNELLAKAPGGATTAVGAAVSVEVNSQGREQIYLHCGSVGDSQIILLARQADGLPYMRKLVEPADVIEHYLRAEEFDYDNVTSLKEIYLARQRIVEKYKDVDPRVADAANAGITSFLGPKPSNEMIGKLRRFNLSREVLSKGMTDLRVVVCSDNVGEKTPEEELKAIYNSGRASNARIASDLIRFMGGRNLDDGCLAIATVGRHT